MCVGGRQRRDRQVVGAGGFRRVGERDFDLQLLGEQRYVGAHRLDFSNARLEMHGYRWRLFRLPRFFVAAGDEEAAKDRAEQAATQPAPVRPRVSSHAAILAVTS